MILYLDTSALLKLYVDEEGSRQVQAEVLAAEDTLTSIVAYAEARAALARARRERVLTPSAHRVAVEHLDADWTAFAVVHVTEAVVRRAGSLAEQHRLRGFDAIHLASAMEAAGDLESRGFGCFDAKLAGAARREGFHIVGRPTRA